MSSKRGSAVLEGPQAVSPMIYSPAPGWKQSPPGNLVPDWARTNSQSAGRAVASTHADHAGTRETEIRERTFHEGFAQARAEYEAAIKTQRDAISEALREFAKERDTYFHKVEGEVVALALAVVRKILRRESQIDPLLLSGLVRVALERTSSSHTTRLRVHPSQVAVWKNHFKSEANLPIVPEVEEDATLQAADCRLETEFGATDLGVELQLKEIEKGLFDLLAQRPAPR